MIVWHVTSRKKILKYIEQRGIKPPVRAWKDINEAERFSKQTGRQIILRLKFPTNALMLEGHQNKAVYINKFYELEL